MPNRIIKESICTSDTIEALTLEEEIFFYRLMVNCDDYGCMDGRADILRAKCFPLRLEKVKTKDIEKWLISLRQQGLIVQYIANDKPYLKLAAWEKHQQIRAHKRKYPSPDDEGTHLISDDIRCNQMISDVTVIQSNPNPNPIQSIYSQVEDAFQLYCVSLPRIKEMSPKRTKAIKALIDDGRTIDDFEQVFKNAEASDFLSGRNGRWTACNFDWLIKKENFIKALEGTYNNKKSITEQSLDDLGRWAEQHDRNEGYAINIDVPSELPFGTKY